MVIQESISCFSFHDLDLRFISHCLKMNTPALTHVGVLPSDEHFESFQQAYPNEPFEQVLVNF